MRAILILCLAASASMAELSFKKVEEGLRVEKDGKLVFVYRTDQRIACLYPLHGPTGSNLTRHYPLKEGVAGEQKDHPHHVSFWMAHGSVNGIDFWHGKQTRIRHEGFVGEPRVEEGELEFTVNLSWRAKPDGEPLLREKRSYRLRDQGASMTLDVACELTAQEAEVVFGDTKEGTFAIRLTPTLRLKGEVAEGRVLNSEGATNASAWGKRAKWVAYHGPDSEGEAVVVALMDHPKNLRHPTWWHARDYGLLAANPFGQHDFEQRPDEPKLGDFALGKGKVLSQRYRLLMHAGSLDSAGVPAVFDEFAASGSAP